MANRAYLYAANSVPTADWTLPDDSEYYDARWTIPLAWWFLFTPDDMHFADERLRFVADRSTAIQRLTLRRQLLNSMISDRLDPKHVDYFVAILSEWKGNLLLMDPDEVFENDPEDDADTIGAFLTELQQKTLCADAVLDRVKEYSTIEPKDRAEVLIVGYNYGQTVRRLWDAIMHTDS